MTCYASTTSSSLGAVFRVVFPSDRPSPLFSFITQFLSSGAVIYGFQALFSTSCNLESSKVLSFGIVNGIVNMIFASSIIFVTRRKIMKGISPSLSMCRLFLTDPVVILYLMFLIWEIVWFCWTGKKSELEECHSVVVLQLVFLAANFVVGILLFIFTFSTEICRIPQWRVEAEKMWGEQQRAWNLQTERESEPLEEPTQGNDESCRSKDAESTTQSSLGSLEFNSNSYSTEYLADKRNVTHTSTFDRSNSMATPSTSWK